MAAVDDGQYWIGKPRDGGYCYRIVVRGITLEGWRAGTREEVEAHVKKSTRLGATRARGDVTFSWAGGASRAKD